MNFCRPAYNPLVVDFDGTKDRLERDRNQPDFSNADIAIGRYVDLSIEANRQVFVDNPHVLKEWQ